METDTPANEIPWDEIIKKEARGIDDADLGEVQEVNSDNVVTQKGTRVSYSKELSYRL